MILVDSSVWVDFFRGLDTTQVEQLDQAIRQDRVVVGDLILTEVLQGFVTEREFRLGHSALTAFQVVPIGGPVVAVQAARNYRELRRLGVTVRKTIDALIATRCLEDDLTLLYSDRDFDPFVRHLGLKSAEVT